MVGRHTGFVAYFVWRLFKPKLEERERERERGRAAWSSVWPPLLLACLPVNRPRQSGEAVSFSFVVV